MIKLNKIIKDKGISIKTKNGNLWMTAVWADTMAPERSPASSWPRARGALSAVESLSSRAWVRKGRASPHFCSCSMCPAAMMAAGLSPGWAWQNSATCSWHPSSCSLWGKH
ncbi:hypothetical protein LAZ67_2005907 [Cordylochernes scorpioides]|uniref:Uncharacterized protein n=1 Tax=Cordylochernes scorpioides TaxID=51811 RepID=A0ABY6K5M7_9ARAC|nr:hypothetical protein LAZ67_2005907 [Cordylochernes scorpioides]